MSLKKYIVLGMCLAGGTISFLSTDVSAKTPQEVMKEIEPLMKTLALDLISIDGIVGDEQEMVNNFGGEPRVLSKQERIVLAQKMHKVMSPTMTLTAKEKEELKSAKAIMIGAMLPILSKDGKESASELAALEDYRSVFAPETSLKDCRDLALKETKRMRARVRRSEVPVNLKGIKTAQIQYEAMYDMYIPASLYPDQSLDLKPWVGENSGGFKIIGWEPLSNVRGSYMVSTTATNFTATGIIDADGDGVYATYVATKSENPSAPITPPDVY